MGCSVVVLICLSSLILFVRLIIIVHHGKGVEDDEGKKTRQGERKKTLYFPNRRMQVIFCSDPKGKKRKIWETLGQPALWRLGHMTFLFILGDEGDWGTHGEGLKGRVKGTG